MFDNSPNSLAILNYFDEKFGQIIAPIGLFKVCALISSQLERPRLSLVHITPPRQFKTWTSKDAIAMFPDFVYEAGSDFTIPHLYKDTEGDLDRKCIVINDGTVLFRSKTSRGSSRVMGGLAELIADEKYHYGDYKTGFDLKGRCNCIMNMALASFQRNERALEESTFLDKFLVLFYRMPLEEQLAYMRKNKWRERAGKQLIMPEVHVKIIARKVQIGNYAGQLELLVKDFSALSGRAPMGQADAITALASAHAILNNRFWLCDDDIEILRIARDYVSNPNAPNKGKIIQYWQQGRSIRDICLSLGREYEKYRPYVSKVLKDAQNEGVIDTEAV